MTHEVLKWVHILSAFLLFGTGLGSAFYKFMADRSGDLRVIAATNRHVVLADWLFTSPTVIIQPLTGLLLLSETGVALDAPWVIASLGLFVLAGASWLPVVWLQIRMKAISQLSLETGAALPLEYHRLRLYWFWLGWPAFIAILVIVWLMIAKPELW